MRTRRSRCSASIVLLAALTLAVSFLRACGPGRVCGRTGDARLAAVLLRPEVLAFFAACLCMNVAHGALYAFYSIYLEAAGYSKTAIGVLWTLGVLAEIALFLVLPRLLRRYSLRAVLAASCALAALRFALIGWGVHSAALLALAQLLHAATFGAYHASSVAIVHRLFAGALAARGQTLHSSVSYGLGGSAGTLLAGWCWGALGPELSFSLSSLAAVLATRTRHLARARVGFRHDVANRIVRVAGHCRWLPDRADDPVGGGGRRPQAVDDGVRGRHGQGRRGAPTRRSPRRPARRASSTTTRRRPSACAASRSA